MRRAWVLGCLVLLAACSNKVKESAVALTITFPNPGWVPTCVRVTASDATAPDRESSERIDSATLARHAEDRKLVLAVYRERGWSEQLQVKVASYSTQGCDGEPVETRSLAAAVTLPAKGTVPAELVLKAQDMDGDGHPASSMEDKAINGTDCNDGRSEIHPGAESLCSKDINVDYDCDKVLECIKRPNGQSCQDSTKCASGHCVDGICCDTACDTPPQCGGAGACGTGKCTYATVVGKACNDNNNCTTGDTCAADGQCAGSAVTCNTQPGQCFAATGTCNPADGGCNYAPLVSGTACDDSSACTTGEKCNGAGACAGGTVKVCNSSSPGWPGQCFGVTGACIPEDGGCIFPTADAGTSCNDTQSCTHSDQCNGSGACSGTAYTCTPNECQQPAPACAGDGGCLFTADNGKNGAACTMSGGQQGICRNGTCSGFSYIPSNFDPDSLTPQEIAALPSVNLTCDARFDSTTRTWTMEAGCPPPNPLVKTVQPSSGPEAVVLLMKQLDTAIGKSLVLVGDKPVIFIVYGNATVSGKVFANTVTTGPGPRSGAGSNWSGCGAPTGTRTGGAGTLQGTDPSGGGGGGGAFGDRGGNGGRGSNGSSGGLGGTALASMLSPLLGGCPGGTGSPMGASTALGGGGGGAVQLSVAGTLQVKDIITVSGGGGLGGSATASLAGGGAGGGSGGGLLLEAANLDIVASARLTANGGGGGQGGARGSPAVTGQDGRDGEADTANQAAGGNLASAGIAGSEGGAGTTTAAANVGNGNDTNGGGGGGGAVGRIRLNGITTCNVATGSIISPAYSKATGTACPP